MANPLKNRKGMTLVEVVISAVLLSLVLLGAVTIQIGMLNVWQKGASGTNANTYASIAMRRLVLDIEEGSSASASGSNLVIAFPYYDTSTGDYVRTSPGVTRTYYLSGENGTEPSGQYLWRSDGTTNTLLAKNVDSIVYGIVSSKLVQITLTGTDQEGGAITPKLVQMSVKLRNS
jgi:prepilin-type N-terminal cleavage/methylation domain-containing protein